MTDPAAPAEGGSGPAVAAGAAGAASAAAAKRRLRQAVLRRRAARSVEQRERDDRDRFERLRAELVSRPPRRLVAYLSFGTEPDTLRLVAWAAATGLEVLLPVLTDGSGAWLPAPAWAAYEGPDRLRQSRGRILEPTGPVLSGPVFSGSGTTRSGPTGDPLTGTDLVVVPGLAGDPQGGRLGRGGGWYDRVLTTDVPAWLLLNDEEVVERVPVEPWDRPVDAIVTPAALAATQRGGRGGGSSGPTSP